MTTSDPEHHGSQDPEPSRTPDTRKRFSISGWLTLLAVAVIVIIFVVAIFGILS
ncbi:hypothetical protein LRS71_08905 [Rhodococcus pyridinivorans]|uniref:hypothetical protein n=1 Tax=Rhodococcus pyridinivorans TaxID=103816 RepID=UPI001E4D388F|nr:hypothetical protein [Rhodococcus pyridinivorans]MCD5419673.1 hypothetical protein [Rhodococcus pyridinivorans]